MRTPLLVLLLAACLLAPHALAQPGKAQPPTLTPGDRDDEEEDGDGDDRGRPDGQRTDARRADDRRGGDRPAAVGEFALSASGQSVNGDFVDFAYNDTTLTGFTVAGTALFDLSVAGPRDEDDHGVVAKGAQLRLATPYYDLRVHDTPSAVVKLETSGAATLLFRGGANLTQLDHERVEFTVGNLTGTLRGAGVRVAGPSVIAEGELLLLVHRPAGGFDVHRGDIGKAVASRHVGAEASINQKPDGTGVEEEVVSYGNVTLTTVKAEKGNLTLLIDGHGFDGRVVVLNVDGRVVGASRADDLRVQFDNETIAHASSIQDVLDPDDDGLQAEYYVVFDPAAEAFQLLVSVPHYSVHTLSVTTFLQAAAPSIVAGVLVGVLVLAASGVVLFRRPKQ